MLRRHAGGADRALGRWRDDAAPAQIAARRAPDRRSRRSRSGAEGLAHRIGISAARVPATRDARPRPVSSDAMTAIALLLLLIAGAAGYVSWADYRIAHGDPAWWFVAGAPLAYLLPVLLLASLWFTLSWIWRTPRPPEYRLGPAACARLFLGEVGAVALSWPLMVAHRLLIADPTPAPAPLPLLLVHGVAVNDGVWFAVAARSRAARPGPGVHDQLRAAACRHRAFRRPARLANRRHLRGHRRGTGRADRAQHGRIGRTRVSATLRCGAHRAADHDRHAASRQHAGLDVRRTVPGADAAGKSVAGRPQSRRKRAAAGADNVDPVASRQHGGAAGERRARLRA